MKPGRYLIYAARVLLLGTGLLLFSDDRLAIIFVALAQMVAAFGTREYYRSKASIKAIWGSAAVLGLVIVLAVISKRMEWDLSAEALTVFIRAVLVLSLLGVGVEYFRERRLAGSVPKEMVG
jgi:uncharacterized membrane protein YoaK (UPF0700 family)